MNDDIDFIYEEWKKDATPQEIHEEEMQIKYIKEAELFYKCVMKPNNLIFGNGLWTEEWDGNKYRIKKEYK